MSVEDRCAHGGCSYDSRLEYCEIEAAASGGDTSIVTDTLDQLLYDSGVVHSDEYNLADSREEQVLNRSFSYIGSDFTAGILSLLETKVAICHTQNKQQRSEMYQVAVSWRSESQESNDNYFVRTYGMSTHEGGAVQAYIEEPIIGEESGGRETRRMTPYDCVQLFEELAILDNMHIIERRRSTLA